MKHQSGPKSALIQLTVAWVALSCASADAGLTFVAGTDAGFPNEVRSFDGAGNLLLTLNPYAPGFGGGVRVAAGDLNGDGEPDIITGAGPGAGGGHVRVFDGTTGVMFKDFFAYAPAFTGGVRVATGDVNGDGQMDIVTGADAGSSGGHVRVFDGNSGAILQDFFAFDAAFSGGVRVAAGDVDGDGRADIVAGAGSGGSHVKVFSGSTGSLLQSFFAFGVAPINGVDVAAGDLDGDFRADIVTGAGSGGVNGHVKVFDGATFAESASFFAFGGFGGGVRVATGDIDGDGIADLASALDGASVGQARVYTPGGALVTTRQPFGPSYTGGMFIAGVVVPEPCTAVLLGVIGLAAIRRRSSR